MDFGGYFCSDKCLPNSSFYHLFLLENLIGNSFVIPNFIISDYILPKQVKVEEVEGKYQKISQFLRFSNAFSEKLV